jgi:hypothetical protein
VQTEGTADAHFRDCLTSLTSKGTTLIADDAAMNQPNVDRLWELHTKLSNAYNLKKDVPFGYLSTPDLPGSQLGTLDRRASG